MSYSRKSTKTELDQCVSGMDRKKQSLIVELDAELAGELEATLRIAAANIALELTRRPSEQTGEDRERMNRTLELHRQLAEQIAAIMKANGWDDDAEA
jgi:hypothetical protein